MDDSEADVDDSEAGVDDSEADVGVGLPSEIDSDDDSTPPRSHPLPILPCLRVCAPHRRTDTGRNLGRSPSPPSLSSGGRRGVLEIRNSRSMREFEFKLSHARVAPPFLSSGGRRTKNGRELVCPLPPRRGGHIYNYNYNYNYIYNFLYIYWYNIYIYNNIYNFRSIIILYINIRL